MIKKVIIPLSIILFLILGNVSSLSSPTINHTLGWLSDRKFFLEVTILLQIYGDYFQKIEEREGDIAFLINDSWVYYRNGKMLCKEHFQDEDRYESIFYDYPIGRLTKIPSYREIPRRASDFLDQLFGKTEIQIRKHGQLVSFLNHKAFVNCICIEPLKEVEKQIIQSAEKDPEVKAYIDNLYILYSFQTKKVIGSQNVSNHSYGLAIDLVPRSYHRKHVYWKWSAVLDKKWPQISLNRRWSPPQGVIDAFERNGFVWGGKWSHFDMIHFEYRPEIIRLTQPSE